MPELRQQRAELRFGDARRPGQFDRVDQHGAAPRKHRERRVGQGGGGCARRREAVPPDTDPGTRQRARVEEGGVAGGPPGRRRGRRVGRVRPGQRGQEGCGVGDGARHRARGVLRQCDWHDPVPADQPEGGLEPDDAAGTGRADDAAVGLGANRDRHQAGRDRDARAGAGAGGVAVQCVRVGRLPAQRAPAAGGVGGAEVGPLRQVRLADDHRSRPAQPADAEGVTGFGAGQCGRAGGRRQAAGRDVVLDQHRDAGQWPGDGSAGARGVTGLRLCQRVRADGDHRVQQRVEPIDPGQAELGQCPGADLAGGQRSGQRRDGGTVGIDPGAGDRLGHGHGFGHGGRIRVRAARPPGRAGPGSRGRPRCRSARAR